MESLIKNYRPGDDRLGDDKPGDDRLGNDKPGDDRPEFGVKTLQTRYSQDQETTPMAMPERALCIRLKLVLIFGMIDHLLRIIHDDAAVGETALQHQAVMYPDMVVYAAVISSAVFAKWTVPFCDHLVIYLFVPLADHLILLKVVQGLSSPTCPSGCCHLFG